MRPKPPEQPVAPESLHRLQTAFGKAMASPFRFLDDQGTFETRNETYPEGITDLIQPRPDKGLDGAQRLSTYNQQYWFRLFSTLHKEMPLIRHLLGALDMNKLVTAYLAKYPSRSYDLRHLTRDLEQFLAEEHEYRLPVLQQAARLDRLFILAFDAPYRKSLSAEDLADMAGLETQALTFQPHWFLFEEDWNLVAARKLAAAHEGDELDLELTAGKGYHAVWRNVEGVVTQELGPLQYHLLDLLADGIPLNDALTALTDVLDEQALEFLGANLQVWFAEWVAMGWICKKR